ncbi:hypothetical protein ID866_3474 [Astraeus odoratus]|nr:hypothetical protein ID866_3474 [Astraeus odoratus]
MAKTELIDSHVSLKQCELAVEALHEYATKREKEQEENELLPGREQHVWLQVTVKVMQPVQKLKPIRVPLKYTLIDPRSSAVCLITKDPQREYKDLLEQHNVKFISRVVGIEKLKGKFKSFEARRLLLKENALFLADDRVIPLLPRLLGSKWFDAKKQKRQPIPVNLKRKDLKAELERAIQSSYMHQNKGTCTSVKVGTLSQTPKQILANIQTALPAIIGHIKQGWENIQCLHIKTSSSISLPIWSCDLSGEGEGRWAGMTPEKPKENEDKDMSMYTAPSRSPIPPMKSSPKPLASISKTVMMHVSERRGKSSKIPEGRLTKVEDPSPPARTTISQKEVKAKRSEEAGEKKKARIVKGKTSRTPKGVLLGKKVGKS